MSLTGSKAVQAVRVDPGTLRYLPAQFRSGGEVSLQAVTADTGAAQWIEEDFRADRSFSLQALESNWTAFIYQQLN